MKRVTLRQLTVLSIRKVYYSDAFLYARRLVPIKKFKKALELEGLNKGNKVTLDRCFRAILWAISHGEKLSLRHLSKIGHNPLAKTMTNMPEKVSHVAIVKLLQNISVDKLHEIVHQMIKGYKAGAYPRKKAYQHVYLMDTTVLSYGHKRKGKKRPGDNDIPFTKLCARQLPQTYIPDQFFLSHNQSDKEAFEGLIEWDQEGKTYVFDMGHFKLSFYGKITSSGNTYVTKLHPQMSVTWHKKHSLPKSEQQRVGQYVPKKVAEVTIGSRRKKQQQVKMVYVERVKPVPDEKEPKRFWIITNSFTWKAKQIVEYWNLRWQVETYYNWLKNTIGFQGTQWATSQGMTVFLLLVMLAMVCLLAWCSRHHGIDWWQADKFSLGEALRTLCALLDRFWVYRTFQRLHKTPPNTTIPQKKVMKM